MTPQRTERIRGRRRMERNRRILRDSPLCIPCKLAGRVTEATEVDHIKSLMHGGTEDEANLQSICSTCNKLKEIAEMGQRAKAHEIQGLDWQ